MKARKNCNTVEKAIPIAQFRWKTLSARRDLDIVRTTTRDSERGTRVNTIQQNTVEREEFNTLLSTVQQWLRNQQESSPKG
jgi:hypothetical protein